MKGCLHEFAYSEPIGEFVCVKCGHVITKEDKRGMLEHAQNLMRAEADANAQWVTTITNADRIRAMSDEELAEFMADKPLCPDYELFDECPYNCSVCWGKWLKQPVKDGEGE